MNVQPALPQVRMQLDWQAYYKRFAGLHGGSPIVYKGRQLFADGWGYSATDYAGPEYPPPKDKTELAKLQKVYWYTRWNRAKNELLVLEQRYAALKGLQSDKSAPLQQVVTTQNEDTKKYERHTGDWCPQVFEHTISFLQSEIDLADKHLNQLKEQIDGKPDDNARSNPSESVHVARPDRDEPKGEVGPELNSNPESGTTDAKRATRRKKKH